MSRRQVQKVVNLKPRKYKNLIPTNYAEAPSCSNIVVRQIDDNKKKFCPFALNSRAAKQLTAPLRQATTERLKDMTQLYL